MASLPEWFVITWGPEDIAADSDALKYAVLPCPAGKAIEVLGAFLAAETTVAAADAYNTFYLRNNSLTGNAICSLAQGPAATGTAITQTPVSFGAIDAAHAVVGSRTAATNLFLTVTKTGVGTAVPGAKLFVFAKYVPIP